VTEDEDEQKALRLGSSEPKSTTEKPLAGNKSRRIVGAGLRYTMRAIQKLSAQCTGKCFWLTLTF
jgi:hypothetical protein